ncbi:MAG: TetR/AcrR family transcriptional regulator [Actinomycetota bacterium]
MKAHVNPTTRKYNSPRRAQQAAATRLAILQAAQRLFEARGYPTTTMEDIADEAKVALKTVYVAFSTKAKLLRALWDQLLKGNQQVSPVAEREWYLEVMREPLPKRQLRLHAKNSCTVKQRIAGLLRVIRNASTIDEDIAELWSLIQSDFYENQRAIVESLKAKKALRRGIDVARGTDILWTLNHPDIWLLLTGERGWTPNQFERWLSDTTIAQLLNEG